MSQKVNCRTMLALGLTAIALAVPCAAWYIVGCREAERRAGELQDQQWRNARETAVKLAERVRTRLETLREAESRRPFYQYQNLYHDPRGAYEGASVVPSPLAQGPSDPLVRANFQVDSKGKVTLPTINEDVIEVNESNDVGAQRAIQKELQPVAQACVALAKQADVSSQARANLAPNAPPVQQRQIEAQQSSSLQPAPQVAQVEQRKKVEVLDSSAYQQTLDANKVYSNIKGGNTMKGDPYGVQQNASKKPQGVVRVGVSDFRWHTVAINKEPTLVALRTAATPDGTLVQGFAIASDAVAESLKGAAFPARFVQAASGGEGEIRLNVAETGWQVTLDAYQAMADARAAAQGVKKRFLQLFFGGVGAAVVAGLCVVGLVWQTERIARQRSQFAASAAHELRTPLAGLRIYSEMLAEGLGDPSRAKEYAHRVASEAERLGRVVSNVLGFTRLERGMLKVQPELGDLGAAVRECVARQQAALEAAGARVEVSIAEGLPQVRFDRDAVAQIVQNLLDNAEKHTRSASDRTIRVGVASTANGATLSVTDHGPGLPAEVRRRLFRPFTRGNKEDAPAGLGLGLVLVQALARAQGGEVSYADATGGGATFTVKFHA